MLRVRNALATSLQGLRFYPGATHAASDSARTLYMTPGRGVAVIATTTALSLWCFSNNLVHNDAPQSLPSKVGSVHSTRINSTGMDENGLLCAVVWGSNKSNLIDPQSPETETFQTPVNVKWLENTALRDMALHEKHAACVDIRGDVFQWGDGFFISSSENMAPKATLRGENIIKIQVTESRVYALSASGSIYVLAANGESQKLTTQRTTSATPWWMSDWLGREQQSIGSLQIFPKETLKWGEKFVSIAAGNDHLLALTSEGRTYAHPINENANSHGQLGLQNVGILAQSSPASTANDVDRSLTNVELVPQSVAGQMFSRESTNIPSEHRNVVNDRHIEFYDGLFEIPSLKGVKVSQIAAGGRSSFVNTSSGRVLGWGANEHGQIGLGSGITLDTITVPTEIDLTRNVSVSTESRCLSIVAGGDLTCFVAERNPRDSFTYVDILACGNGQWGGLGNNTYSTFRGNPVRMRNISGLREFNEQKQRLTPIIPYTMSVSPTGHVLLSLDTQLHGGPGGSGRDLVAWGLNHDYQLGTGKRSSLCSPTVLERPEGGRFILASRKATVRDLSGKIWKKNVEVEQCAIAGHSSSVVYWKTRL